MKTWRKKTTQSELLTIILHLKNILSWLDITTSEAYAPFTDWIKSIFWKAGVLANNARIKMVRIAFPSDYNYLKVTLQS